MTLFEQALAIILPALAFCGFITWSCWRFAERHALKSSADSFGSLFWRLAAWHAIALGLVLVVLGIVFAACQFTAR